jgi:hypothetical protein
VKIAGLVSVTALHAVFHCLRPMGGPTTYSPA